MTKKTLPLIFAIAFCFGVFAQSGTLSIHQGQTVHEFSIADVDSLVFYRYHDETIPKIIVLTRIDTVLFTDTVNHRPSLNIIDGRWLTSLGVTSFASDNTWRISKGRITQIWSDAVTATACQKTTFYGGSLVDDVWVLNVDCRSNPGFPGDLFSWLAVQKLSDELCPYPWRVPTIQDFIDLDVALGGTGHNRGDTREFVEENFINRWGGAFGGGSGPTGNLWHQNSWGDYWSQSTKEDTYYGYYLFFSKFGSVGPRNFDGKNDGLHLRCVK